MTTTTNNDNRRKIIRVPHCEVMNILRGTGVTDASGFVYLRRAINLPEGTKVCSVQSNYMAQAFDFVVEHDSFEPVPDCQQLPAEYLQTEAFRLGTIQGNTFMPETVNAATLPA
jgi:hypothetical protein